AGCQVRKLIEGTPMLRRFIEYGFVLILFNVPVLASDNMPPWLEQAARANVPVYDKDVPAVVLLDEVKIAVEADDRLTTTKHYVVRILSRDGRVASIAREIYTSDTRKVREMRAWLLRSSGEIKRYGKDQVLDVAAVGNDVYNDVRAKLIVASEDA